MEQTQELLSSHVRLSEDGRRVRILDQSQLPNREVYLELSGLEELCEAIIALRVRGAPAIGIFAGYGVYVLARQLPEGGAAEENLAVLSGRAGRLAAARPTAVNLAWAVDRMLGRARRALPQGWHKVLAALEAECLAIHREDIAMCRAIAEYGLSLVREGDGILTHCNAGPLATSRYGTALGPILLGQERGVRLRVFADETRPLLQGARLTAYELSRAGVDVTLICDSMASMVMRNGWVQACFVGCDRATRLVPAGWPSWPGITESHSMCWAPLPPLTWTAPRGRIFPSRSGTRRRSGPCGTRSLWRRRG